MIAVTFTFTFVPFLAEELMKMTEMYGMSKTHGRDELYQDVMDGKKRIEKQRQNKTS